MADPGDPRAQIAVHHQASIGTCGPLRITADLREAGIEVIVKTAAKATQDMRIVGIGPRIPRRDHDRRP